MSDTLPSGSPCRPDWRGRSSGFAFFGDGFRGLGSSRTSQTAKTHILETCAEGTGALSSFGLMCWEFVSLDDFTVFVFNDNLSAVSVGPN
jgi:hypothetical protein